MVDLEGEGKKPICRDVLCSQASGTARIPQKCALLRNSVITASKGPFTLKKGGEALKKEWAIQTMGNRKPTMTPMPPHGAAV